MFSLEHVSLLMNARIFDMKWIRATNSIDLLLYDDIFYKAASVIPIYIYIQCGILFIETHVVK